MRPWGKAPSEGRAVGGRRAERGQACGKVGERRDYVVSFERDLRQSRSLRPLRNITAAAT